MLVVPTEHADKFLFETISPESELIGFRTMATNLRCLIGANPLRPHESQDAIAQQAKLVGCTRSQSADDPLGAVSIFGERYSIAVWRNVAVEGSAGRGEQEMTVPAG